ncbi:hypothetical protein BH09PAT2_BH09PAT2_06480 [soil metagenome]
MAIRPYAEDVKSSQTQVVYFQLPLVAANELVGKIWDLDDGCKPQRMRELVSLIQSPTDGTQCEVYTNTEAGEKLLLAIAEYLGYAVKDSARPTIFADIVRYYRE